MYTDIPQLDGSPLAGYNCNCAVCASQIRFATGDRLKPDGAEVRRHVLDHGSPDRSGGTRLDQMADVAQRVYGVHMDVYYDADYEQVWDWLHDPTLALDMSILYRPLHGTPFDSDPAFDGNHAIGGNDGKIGDPLADGRRHGILSGMQTWPKALLREACGALNVGEMRYQALGAGKAYCTVVHAPKAPQPTPHPAPAPTTIFRYGGEARARGDYKIRDVGTALVRTTPNNTGHAINAGRIPVGTVVLRVLGNRPLPFHVAQTTYTGAPVGGERRWHGDATGKRWIHHSLVTPA